MNASPVIVVVKFGYLLVKLPPDEYLDFINGLCGIDFIDDKSTLVLVLP